MSLMPRYCRRCGKPVRDGHDTHVLGCPTREYDPLFPPGLFTEVAEGLNAVSTMGIEELRVELVKEQARSAAWRLTIPICNWSGCPKLGVKWIARHVLYCDEHGASYLQDAPWAELARKEGL